MFTEKTVFAQLMSLIPRRDFNDTSENAVYIQIWIAVCSFLILALDKKRLRIEHSLYTISQTLSFMIFKEVSINQLFNKN